MENMQKNNNNNHNQQLNNNNKADVLDSLVQLWSETDQRATGF